MTAICLNNGPSSIKDPLSAASQLLSPQALIALFVSAEIDWFSAVAGSVGYLAFDILNICAVDPPPLPTIDAPRFASYFASTQGAQFAREDTVQWATNLMWHAYCKCNTGPAPPPPVVVPQPTGIQVDTNPSPGPSGPSCSTYQQFAFNDAWDANGNVAWTVRSGGPLNPGSQWINALFSISNVDDTTTMFPVTTTITFLDTGGAILGAQSWVSNTIIPGANQEPHNFVLPVGTVSTKFSSHSGTHGAGLLAAEADITSYCTPPPNGIAQPCCPPDPQLTLLINQVMQLEQLILTSLPKPLAPTVDSTVHANLSGNGRVSISPTAAGVRVEITARPTPWPSGQADPNYLFSIGFITPRAQGTALRGSRLVYDHQIFEYPYYVDEVDYALALGVTIRLIELVTSSA